MSRIRYSEEIKTKAVELYESGESLVSVCRRRRMPNDVNTVRKWLVDRDVSIRTSTHVYPRAEILEALERDIPRSEICDTYGCSTKYLSNLATGKLKVERPKKKKKASKKRHKKKV